LAAVALPWFCEYFRIFCLLFNLLCDATLQHEVISVFQKFLIILEWLVFILHHFWSIFLNNLVLGCSHAYCSIAFMSVVPRMDSSYTPKSNSTPWNLLMEAGWQKNAHSFLVWWVQTEMTTLARQVSFSPQFCVLRTDMSRLFGSENLTVRQLKNSHLLNRQSLLLILLFVRERIGR
jgi:hypothetical protein